MISFASDYIAGAHPKILERLAATNLEDLPGYGTDIYCERAREKIRAACGCPQADVEFLVGGTQANAVVISTLLHDHEGVISASTGHISTHEAGAIEFTGHKVLEIAHDHGKIRPDVLRKYLEDFYADENHEHMVFPGMVYLSYPTEYGTLYPKEELIAIADACRAYGILLYIDGARLGYGLMSRACDLTLSDIAALADVFYIGGTKVGALCGEAVVFTRKGKPRHFMASVKKRGALLAKGRLLGIQFDTLFTDDLYFEISRHVICMAEELKAVFREKGLAFYLASPTNQQFVLLEDDRMDALKEQVLFSYWERYDASHTVVRFATGWSTTKEDIRALRELL